MEYESDLYNKRERDERDKFKMMHESGIRYTRDHNSGKNYMYLGNGQFINPEYWSKEELASIIHNAKYHW